MRPKCLVVTVAALNLVAGVSFGFVLGRHVTLAHLDHAPERAIQDVVHDPEFARLADNLGLDAEKASRVRAILASCAPRCDAITDETRPKLHALHEQLRGELTAVLTPEELARLDDEFRKRFGEMPHERH